MQPVGILALQGDFAEHADAMAAHGIPVREVRVPADLQGLSGFILPGGESSTMLKLLAIQGLREPLHSLLVSGLPVLATCAGLILLAREVIEPEQDSFGLLDMKVCRNGYGRQIRSGTFELEGQLPAGTRAVFIRAPRVLEHGPDLEVLARRDGDPVFLRKGRILATCFHPELEEDHPVTQLFVAMLREQWGLESAQEPGTHQAEMA
ncbi:MAG: pyridoxal 5'-phosphate synthase glutaminase subunit PdxT [Planctomycetota bacterium]|jgi:5'-phosphate synthase pdxT subunit